MLFINKKIRDIPCIFEFFKNVDVDTKNSTVGWGRKPSFARAQIYAKKNGRACVCLEDGFVRSLGLGKAGYPPLSLVIDKTGIYFDALQTSDLEKKILEPENNAQNKRALSAIEFIQKNKITKYNQHFEVFCQNQFTNKKNILVVDQTYGDQSIHYAGATPETFQIMLDTACRLHPEATIWVKTHPDVIAGKARGHFSTIPQNVQYITENYHPFDLLDYMDDVYVVSSQLGFEALLAGKNVTCFGLPWYAGWGLTNDTYAPLEHLKNRRYVTRTLPHLFYCAYIQYAQYVSPVTQKKCELEDILYLVAENKKFQQQLPRHVTVYGFSRWKRKFMREFLDFPQTLLSFKNLIKPRKDDDIVAWGKKAHRLKMQNYPHVCTVEDGFIRSLGLGASLIRPYSLVFDRVGIYYDATQPSYLEQLLQERTLSVEQLQRAQQLIKKITQLNISKYNVGRKEILKRPSSEKIILVVGQVEDDMSVQLGGVDIKTNLSLLQQVRNDHPDAYIIYKPHPDVHAGLRLGKIEEETILKYAHDVVLDISILDCFKICDEVHTISSLSGFEALLRGLKVYCYGLPFYAGWGLTIDRHSCERRMHQITLESLVYMTLVEYPVYNIPITKNMRLPCVTPECVIDYIENSMNQENKNRSSLASKIFTRVRRFKLGSHQ